MNATGERTIAKMTEIMQAGVQYRTSEIVKLSGLSKATVCVWCRANCTHTGSKLTGYSWGLKAL